jgi:hypothetical protein
VLAKLGVSSRAEAAAVVGKAHAPAPANLGTARAAT